MIKTLLQPFRSSKAGLIPMQPSMPSGERSMAAEDPTIMTGMPTTMGNPPTVVELYQSQGCNSCPPANDNVIRLSEDPDMLVLTYEVTYWDRLGWKDTFGNIAFDERQREYGRALRNRGVYTPQVIVNGVVDGVGSSKRDLNSILQKGTAQAVGTHGTVSVTLKPSSVTATSNAIFDSKAAVYLVRYDPRVIDVHIARGENSGRNLPHKNIVKDVTRLGSFSGGEQTYELPQMSSRDALKFAVLVQAGPGGAILGAARG